jgi:hypothetical protein
VNVIPKLLVLLVMLLGLPLLGIIAAGMPVDPYLEFPPRTRYVTRPPFSWPVFWGLAALTAAAIAPFVYRGITAKPAPPERPEGRDRPFPWWGWAGVAVCCGTWILAWNRFPWLGALQSHTFAPLWLGYILAVNGLVFRRTGRSPLTHHTRAYLSLFPISALFWWFFEYLNRFVQNWHYVGEPFDAWSYFWYATLPFSTVLPAVLATRAWIRSFSWPEAKFRGFLPVRVRHPRGLAWGVLALAGAGLACIGVLPGALFPLLWISPLLILISLETLFSERHVFSPVTRGAWDGVVTAALAALICGFFWEMWNVYSHARWVYSIPYVHRFQLFEMPILGYAGYLPFGLECVAVAELFLRRRENGFP